MFRHKIIHPQQRTLSLSALHFLPLLIITFAVQTQLRAGDDPSDGAAKP